MHSIYIKYTSHKQVIKSGGSSTIKIQIRTNYDLHPQERRCQGRYLFFQDCYQGRLTFAVKQQTNVGMKFAFLSKLFEIFNLRSNGKRLGVLYMFLYFVINLLLSGCVWLILSLISQVQRKYLYILRLSNFSLAFAVRC